ncbi:hypothetical protein AX16_003355 [Volvariella volvacea WC 439]|nr:hypothetical protein AX16_003355 [Volvariella volvacea WC 439]
MSLLILTASDIENVASSISPDELENVMRTTFTLLSSSDQPPQYDMPHRMSISTQNHTTLVMPARIDHPSIGGTAIKTVCVPKSSGDTRGLPATTLVIDEATGVVKAVVNARNLTALRNAGGSLLSTRLVGPKAPASLVAFGAGTQVQVHLHVFLRAYPSISRATIINRSSNPRFNTLTDSLRSEFPHIQIDPITYNSNDPQLTSNQQAVQTAVSEANIIICATSSTTPLFPSSWVKTGTHVILIGSYTPSMKEVDNDLVKRAVDTASDTTDPASARDSTKQIQRPILLVDSRKACAKEAGELISAAIHWNQVVEIGEYAAKPTSGDTADTSAVGGKTDQDPGVASGDGPDTDRDGGLFRGPITMFKSVGVGVQDVAIACAVVEKAKELKVGTYIEGYD